MSFLRAISLGRCWHGFGSVKVAEKLLIMVALLNREVRCAGGQLLIWFVSNYGSGFSTFLDHGNTRKDRADHTNKHRIHWDRANAQNTDTQQNTQNTETEQNAQNTETQQNTLPNRSFSHNFFTQVSSKTTRTQFYFVNKADTFSCKMGLILKLQNTNLLFGVGRTEVICLRRSSSTPWASFNIQL